MPGSPVTAMRSKLSGAIARRPATSAALERLGAFTLADRADRRRTGGDLAAIALPPAPHDLRARRIKALRHAGTDQCVEAFHDGGWWAYERPLPDVLLTTLRATHGTFLDVGANTGVYTLIASRVRGVAVHAFEPMPAVAAMLRENLRLNPWARGVTLVEAAVADVDGSAELYVPADSGLVETSASIESGFRTAEYALSVPVVALDTYWDRTGRPPVAVVKVDVEGAEHRVLAGAQALLAAARPVVLYEVLPEAHLDALERLRAHVGYVDLRLSRWEVVVGDAIRFHELALNHALVPREHVERFVSWLAPLGLVVTDLRGAS